MSRVQTLKIWPHFRDEVDSGRMPFQIRDTRDRTFQAGDVLQLDGYEIGGTRPVTGPPVYVEVVAVYTGLPGLLPGYVAMSVRKFSHAPNPKSAFPLSAE